MSTSGNVGRKGPYFTKRNGKCVLKRRDNWQTFWIKGNCSRYFIIIEKKSQSENTPSFKWNNNKKLPKYHNFSDPIMYVFVSVSLFLCFSLSLSVSLHIHTNTYTCIHRHMHKENIHHVQNTHASHTTNILARTHAHILNTNVQNAPTETESRIPVPLKTYLIFSSSVLLQLLFYLHRTVHLFMLLTISGEIMCGGHQRTLSNRRLPSSQSKPTAVDRQKDYSINYGKRLPEPPKSYKKEGKLNRDQWGASTWCLPSQPLLASMRLRTCQQDRSPVLDGHARRHRQLHTSTRTSRDFSRTRRETCARAVATLPKSRPN